MAPTRIIEALHVREDLCASVLPSHKRPLMNQLGLQRGKEALHDCIVPTVARPTHRALDVQREEPLLVARRPILAAAIRMVHQPCRPSAVLEGHLQGLARENRAQALVHRPAHDPARIQIHEDRHVQPAFAGGHVREITRPFLVWGARREDELQVVSGGQLRRHAAGPAPPPPTHTAEVMPAHQARHPMAPDADPLGPEVLIDPRTTIPTVRRPIAGPDMREQPGILALPRRLAAPTPGVKPTARHLQDPTQDLHWIRGLLRLDEAIPHDDSLAKKAIAFFRMSRSCRTWSSSRRTALSSPVARKPCVPSGILAACRFHRLSVVCPMPSSWATCVAVFPLRRSSSTASCLNSGVNFCRALPIRHLRVAIMPGRCPQNQGKTNFLAKNKFRQGLLRTLTGSHAGTRHEFPN